MSVLFNVTQSFFKNCYLDIVSLAITKYKLDNFTEIVNVCLLLSSIPAILSLMLTHHTLYFLKIRFGAFPGIFWRL